MKSIAILVSVVALAVGSVLGFGLASGSSPPQTQKTYGPGWVNWAHVGPTQPIAQALSGIEGNVGVVYYLSPDTGAWLRYVPGKPEVSNLTTMDFGQSYLMLLTAPMAMTIPTEAAFLATPTACPLPSLAICDSLYPCPSTTSLADFPGDSLCQLLDDLDDLPTYLSTAFAVDCGIDLECSLQCDLDSGFERDVDAVADFLRTSPPFDLSMWQLEHCVGPFYYP